MACNCYSVGDSSLLVVRWIPPLRRADRQTSASASAEGRIVPFTDMKQFDENCMFPTYFVTDTLLLAAARFGNVVHPHGLADIGLQWLREDPLIALRMDPCATFFHRDPAGCRLPALQ